MVSSAEHDSGFWPSLYAQLRGTELDSREWFSPLASAVADDGRYLVRVELPGVTAADITLRVEQDSIVLEGTKANPEHGASVVVFFDERMDGHFVRTFKFPADADLASFTSAMDQGVLEINVPRRPGAVLEGADPEVVS